MSRIRLEQLLVLESLWSDCLWNELGQRRGQETSAFEVSQAYELVALDLAYLR